jgi:hypothetical protein
MAVTRDLAVWAVAPWVEKQHSGCWVPHKSMS